MLRRILPWLGLALLSVSFVCFVLFAPPPRPLAQPRPSTPEGEAPLVIVLDPGHGGQDSGAMCGTVLEKDLTLDVALRAETLLRSAGFTTVLTRASDRYLSLAERAAVANREKHSLFVSIHFNDGERAAASGVETYFAARQTSPGTAAFFLALILPVIGGARADRRAKRESRALPARRFDSANPCRESWDQVGAILRYR